ncbi:MAG: hypothetical protein GY694_04320, partial [Gammaproteobacteria bacterium]|nr:hypothetical protein [Gammaproteobacteria bacterium]
MISFIMKDKLEDSEIEVKKAKLKFNEASEDYRKVIPTNSFVNESFVRIMKNETERLWTIGKRKNNKKVEMLMARRKKQNKEKEPYNKEKQKMKAVKYKDCDLEVTEEDDEHKLKNKLQIYGGAQVGPNIEKILSKEPRFMIHSKIDEIEMEMEIEKGMAKARYELMSRGDDDEDEGGGEEENGSRTCRNRTDYNKTLAYNNLRATDFPTVTRLMEPEVASIGKEVIMEDTKEKLMECVRKYRHEHCSKKGEIKMDNLSTDERQGLKEAQKEIKSKNIVVFTTDKSGKFSVDTPENYRMAMEQHTQKDTEVTESDKEKKVENTMNHHMRQFNKMFKVGSSHRHEDRITGATMSTNIPAPPMYGLRKDHKNYTDEKEGPPVRPVCGATEAPNSRLSSFLSRIVNDYTDSIDNKTECRSSEEMKAAFEEYNGRENAGDRKCQIISMDVKALYPSMAVSEVVKSVRELIESSDEQIEKVDWCEVGKYLAITMTDEEIRREGLQHVLPRRIQNANRRVTVAYLSNKKNEENWSYTRRAHNPGCRQRRKMIGLAVAIGVKACMENHLYKIGDAVYQQNEGGPIGLELTGAVSRAFMWRWDRMYKEATEMAGIEVVLYERYVDDSNQIAVVPEEGAVYDEESKSIKIDESIKEKGEADDERLARVLVEIANSILPCIKMEADFPSRNADQRLPILDMKVWMNQEGKVLYTHYEKPMSNKSVLNSQSAHPASCKRAVHTQEILRRILNCSEKLEWEAEVAPVLSDYMARMKNAGYNESYRKGVLASALNIYDKKKKDEKEGTRPMFRHKNWKKEERRKEKENKKKQWSTKRGHIAPIFVPATPGSELAKQMRAVADREARDGVHFNIIEIGGRTL